MIEYSAPSKITITCKKRLAPFLAEEVSALGFTVTRVFSTGVEMVGTLADCIKLNLNLRCASQVLYSIKSFAASKPEDVYDALLHIPWEDIISVDGYFSVTSSVNHFTVNNSMFINVKVKDAIADRMVRETSKRANSGSLTDHAVVFLHWREEEQAEIFLDTSGDTLAKHGYRKIPGKAPMLEALASACVMATGWDGKSAFVNPMCGSSTIAIEAALIATNRRPGLLRDNYAFMHILGYDPKVFESELQILKDQIQDIDDLDIIATDISDDAIEISKVNAALAGVDHLIKFEVCDFEVTTVPSAAGVVFFNPEYGERLGEVSDLEKTYARIGDFMKKKCQGYTGYIFTGNLDLAKKIGLKASRRIEFFTSAIDCRLLKYDLYSGSKRAPLAEQQVKE